jgi:hypothetical protein
MITVCKVLLCTENKSIPQINHTVYGHGCIDQGLTHYGMTGHIYSSFHFFCHLWSEFEVCVVLSCANLTVFENKQCVQQTLQCRS